MPIPSWLTVSTGLLFTGASLLIGLLGVAWQLGAVANGMNRAADNAANLSGQLRTIMDDLDVQRASSVPDDVERVTEEVDGMSDDLEQVTEGVDRMTEDLERVTEGVDRMADDLER